MDHAKRVYDDIFEMMSSEENPTPLVRISRLLDGHPFALYAKLEWANPFGSIKDRAAYRMLRELELDGELGDAAPGRGIVEPTSGNTGISLAAMASHRGYHMRAVIPERVPEEKKLLLRILGAELDIVPDALCPVPGQAGGTVNLAKTHAKAQKERYVMPNQYENDANVRAHEVTTGPEIWRQTDGKVTHVFCSLGTCGTVGGISRYLRRLRPDVKIVAVQPSEGHDVPGLRNIKQLAVTKLYQPELIDEVMEIDYELAYRRALELCRTEGLLAGPSSGLIFEGARRYIEREGLAEGVGVAIFPDNVLKYVSSMKQHLPELTERPPSPTRGSVA